MPMKLPLASAVSIDCMEIVKIMLDCGYNVGMCAVEDITS